MWEIEPSTQFKKDFRWYEKKRRNELGAVMNNVERYRTLLNGSKNSKCVQAGYLHFEPGGVVAVDQKGKSSNLQETRLYTYAIDESKTLHLIKIGDKQSQHSDIEYCKTFIKQFRSSETNEGG